MKRWRSGLQAGLLALLAAWLAQGCLVTLDSGAVSCDSQGNCPEGYQCAGGFCYLQGQLPAGSSGATAEESGSSSSSGTGGSSAAGGTTSSPGTTGSGTSTASGTGGGTSGTGSTSGGEVSTGAAAGGSSAATSAGSTAGGASGTASGSESGTSAGAATSGSASSTGTSTGESSGGTSAGSTVGATGGTGSTGANGGSTGAGTVEMGITSILATTDSNGTGIFAQQVQAPVTGAVQSLSFYIDPDSDQGGGDSIELGIYADDGGEPDALLSQTASVLEPAPGAWLTLATPAVTVSANSYYWLAYEVSGPSIEYRTGMSGNVCVAPLDVYSSTMPTTFPTCDLQGDPWSFYATILP